VRLSSAIWIAACAVPCLVACNLILGNETPLLINATEDGAASSSSSGDVGAGDGGGREDASPPRTDAGDLPAPERLLYLNASTQKWGGTAQALVLAEDGVDWSEAGAVLDAGILSPAVFVAAGRVYVYGGTSQIETVSEVAASAPLDGDGLGAWRAEAPLPSAEHPKCRGRATDAGAEVICAAGNGRGAIVLGETPGVAAYLGDRQVGGGFGWGPAKVYVVPAATGVLFREPARFVGYSSDVSDAGVQWIADAFTPIDRGNLPDLSDACAVSYRGTSYVMASDTNAVYTYIEVAPAKWEQQAPVVPFPYTNLTCAATTRGIYFLGTLGGPQGSQTRTAHLYFARPLASGAVNEWKDKPSPQVMPDRGSVLIALPASTSD
jgi:hypothetical protein